MPNLRKSTAWSNEPWKFIQNRLTKSKVMNNKICFRFISREQLNFMVSQHVARYMKMLLIVWTLMVREKCVSDTLSWRKKLEKSTEPELSTHIVPIYATQIFKRWKKIKLWLFWQISFQKFWESWKDFETEHGNEDTIREMLRVKRQVAATHNTQVNYMAAAMLAQEILWNYFWVSYLNEKLMIWFFFINLSECRTNWYNRWFGTTRRRRRWKRDANFGTKSCKKASRTRCCGRSRRYLSWLGISNVKFDFEAKIILIINYVLNFILGSSNF